MFPIALLSAFVGMAVAIGDSRSFAVMHFTGGPLTEGRSDPIVSPGAASSHVHTIMGSNAFSNSATGEILRTSTCTNAKLQADKSAYWMPKMYFHNKENNTFESVNLYYMNVYYFFEASNDKIQAFPVGLQMVSGDVTKRTPPATGADVLDPSQGTIQPAQFTCPRSSYNPPSYPAGSNGTMAGMQDPNNQGAGAGFPFANCDGLYSPLRADLHFPSCYDPSKSLTDFKNNMVWPTDAGNGKQDCPEGFIHTPHIFYEMYWDTQPFASRWTPNAGYQPFTLSNGDGEGYSLHGDFMAAWDTTILQTIIDTCDAGDSGMDKCPGDIGAITPDGGSCTIPNPTPEQVTGTLNELPGNNPYFTFGSSAANPAPTFTTPATSAVEPPSTAPATTFHTLVVAPTEPAPSSEAVISTPPAPSTTLATVIKAASDDSTTVTTITSTAMVTETITEPGPRPTAPATVYMTMTATLTMTATVTQTVTASPSGQADVAGFKYAGCFADTVSDRAISGILYANPGGPISNTRCVAYCKASGYSMAGTEYAGQCFCGNSISPKQPIEDSACNMSCEGDSTQICGGPNALSVYTTTGSA